MKFDLKLFLLINWSLYILGVVGAVLFDIRFQDFITNVIIISAAGIILTVTAILSTFSLSKKRGNEPLEKSGIRKYSIYCIGILLIFFTLISFPWFFALLSITFNSIPGFNLFFPFSVHVGFYHGFLGFFLIMNGIFICISCLTYDKREHSLNLFFIIFSLSLGFILFLDDLLIEQFQMYPNPVTALLTAWGFIVIMGQVVVVFSIIKFFERKNRK